MDKLRTGTFLLVDRTLLWAWNLDVVENRYGQFTIAPLIRCRTNSQTKLVPVPVLFIHGINVNPCDVLKRHEYRTSCIGTFTLLLLLLLRQAFKCRYPNMHKS